MNASDEESSPPVIDLSNSLDIPEIQSPQNDTRISELESLVHYLLDNEQDIQGKKFSTIEDALDHLKLQTSQEKERSFLPPYALEDAFGYFKAVDFKPERRLQITYKGQSAVDASGVLRQFYSDVFNLSLAVVILHNYLKAKKEENSQ